LGDGEIGRKRSADFDSKVFDFRHLELRTRPEPCEVQGSPASYVVQDGHGHVI